MLRILAILFGVGFVVFGVAGYMPEYMESGLLFGYFEVDSLHNIVHIATGVIAIIAATGARLAKMFFVLFGLIYLAAAIAGFWRQGDLVMLHTNGADNMFHLVAGVVLLLLGISARTE